MTHRSTGIIPVETTDDYIFSIEVVDLGLMKVLTFVHLEVKRFSPSIWREINDCFYRWRPQFPEIIFTQPTKDDALFRKFIGHFGFQFLSEGMSVDGKTLNYYIHKDINGSFTAAK